MNFYRLSLRFFSDRVLFLKKGQRIVFSTGIMRGRIQHLSQGLKVGDELPPSLAVPTKSSNQPGYFLGVSFNIAGS
jgi:hypothetical protein